MKQFTSYFTGGVLAVALHLSVLLLLVERFGVAPVLATSVGFALGVCVNYYYQYYITFKSARSHKQALPIFVLLAVIMLQLNFVIFWLLWEKLGVHYVMAQIVSTGVVFLANFTINKRYTFRFEAASN